MINIVVLKRTNDYQAYLEGNRAIWGCGQTPSAAIGDLINSHPSVFQIKLIWEGL